MQFIFSKDFLKKHLKLNNKSKKRFKKALRILSKSDQKTDRVLNVHALKGSYSGYFSMNVTGDIRAIFRYLDSTILLFVDIGSHSDLYR